MSFIKCNLGGVLSFLEKPEENNQPLLLCNPRGDLQTFFSYKGDLKDLAKMQVKITLNPGDKSSIEEEIHRSFEGGMKLGQWLVFDLGVSPFFNIKGFFSQFNFFEENMFLPDNIHNHEYVLKNKILRPENDRDNFGNIGMNIKQEFKVIFLTSCKAEEFPGFIAHNRINFKPILVE
ncbi:MAG: hypothetical protein MJ252_27175 [archaeon]|nr:hypothetical protein [archaeon]